MRLTFVTVCLILLLPSFNVFQSVNEPRILSSIDFARESQLSHVRVVSVYQRVTDGIFLINRSIGDVIDLLKETRTDFIFRGWWRFHPCPENATDSSGFFTPDELEEAVEAGYTYEYLKDAVAEIKEELPNVIFCGAIGAQFLHAKRDRNPITGEIFYKNDTWRMALDPSKWGISVTKEEFLQEWSKDHEGYGVNGPFYFPDITNPDFQELLLSWAKKQIDCGVDAIWIDLLYTQAGLFYNYAKDHPEEQENAIIACKDSYRAATAIIDAIRHYGTLKGRKIYVGTWLYPAVDIHRALPELELPKLDFVTVSIPSKEVLSMEFSDERWKRIVEDAHSNFGNILIISLLDWASGIYTGLGTFSQKLTPDEQRRFLRKADLFMCKKGIVFAYPIHGGNMGKEATRLSFGEFKVYDSLAPEFKTYETIVRLAQNKSEGSPLVVIERPRDYLYIFDREIIHLGIPLIVGKITITVDAYDGEGIDRVEFYVNNNLKSTDYDEPYSWLWSEFAIGRYKIRVIAYDNLGKKGGDEIGIIVFNWG